MVTEKENISLDRGSAPIEARGRRKYPNRRKAVYRGKEQINFCWIFLIADLQQCPRKTKKNIHVGFHSRREFQSFTVKFLFDGVGGKIWNKCKTRMNLKFLKEKKRRKLGICYEESIIAV